MGLFVGAGRHLYIVKEPNLQQFIQQIGGLFTKEEDGFTRVWGYLVNESEEIVTFWRHRPGVNFSFMFLASYVRPTTLASKETEKADHGYDPRDPSKRKHRAMVKDIHTAYLDTLDNDGFHYTPNHAASGADEGRVAVAGV